MDRAELNATLTRIEARRDLEERLREEGFNDCLRFLELIEYLDPQRRRMDVLLWENSGAETHLIGIAKVAIVKRYEKSYQEAMRLAEQYPNIDFVGRVSGYLGSEYKEFMAWLG